MKEELNTDADAVRVGEIELVSRHFNAQELTSIALSILHNEEAQRYLEILKKRRTNGNYLG